ncbi:sugar phosphate isomerase/epimerase family protein [Sinomicrobium soli]|uniref:sugar phosphate isomerase/epimerase family protein n=1 Tax=Sinomicrobium sp. N-1-3-6 TaxID=2219864 RepID=UPI000DCDCDD1|nr:sugar phosphate isomerase/epimerase family protein [Sinomicrobium sp. N-1-3-6]RAV27973.1 sugar phosphate isomerase/epimerase [Sinomicrobium sp. N-1-3-6]
MNRRNFLENSGKAGVALSLLGLYACKDTKKGEKSQPASENTVADHGDPLFFKLSLAQWSIHRMIREQGFDPLRFAEKASEWGFGGLEYVNQLYKDELTKNSHTPTAMSQLVEKLRKRSSDHGMKNLIIMVDGEGNLPVKNKADRRKAVENHYKWVDAAAALGCHSIRVNLFGEQQAEDWKKYGAEALSELSDYAAGSDINVLVENHGYFSSDAALLAEVMEAVNMPNCGTLPDFGNFCLKRKDGAQWGAECVEEYDRYKGIRELLPYAKGVSAKSYDFDAEGLETTIDYEKMMRMVKDTGYTGYVGVEYEGNRLSEEEGIKATRDLLLNIGKKIS